MPELPEVETIVRGLRKDVIARTFTHIDVRWAREVATPSSETFASRLVGQTVARLDRRGKYVVFTLTHDFMLAHLKMTGRLYIASPAKRAVDEDRWIRVAFHMDNGQELRFSDARKFGRVYLVSYVDEVVGKLGPEPLTESFTLEAFRSHMARRKGVIKQLLLNQEFVAGIGNIYADEALWLAKIDPRRKVDTLKPMEVANLYKSIRIVLRKGIDFEGASINWYRKPDGSMGESQNYFKAYGREGERCVNDCGSVIHKMRLGQRGTHFCPSCQK